MAVATVILLFVILVCVHFVWSKRQYYALSLKLPSPKALPIVGMIYKLYDVRSLLYVAEEMIAECKSKTIFSWFGPIAFVYTADPEIANIILNNADCINKSVIYDGLKEMVGEGLLTSKAPKWNAHRKLLNPSFKPKVLNGFLPVFNRVGRELCERLDSQVGCGAVDLNKLLLNLGIKTSLETTMGKVLDQDSSASLVEYFEKICDITVQRVIRPWFRIPIIFRLSSLYKPMKEAKTAGVTFIRELVERKVNESKHLNEDNESIHLENNNNINAFIDQAIKIHQNNDLTLDEVVEQCLLLIFEAAETTATAILSTLTLLAMHPQYQEKLFEEICSVFPDKDFEVNSEDFKKLVYLEMCLNETMRIAPGIPAIARDTLNDVTVSQDIVIPKGIQLIIDIFNIHRAVDIWGPDAKSFNPDHFLPINLEGKHKCSFMPFSKGQRNCIGWRYAEMTLKTILVHVLRKYRFTTKFKFEDLRFVENLVLRHDKVACFEIHRRA